MARKLLLLGALICLIVLAQVPPGIATTYDLPSEAGEWEWIETFAEGSGGVEIGSAGSTLLGWNSWGADGFWLIGDQRILTTEGYKIKSPVMVTVDGEVTIDDTYFYTFVYTYDASFLQNETRFNANIPGGPSVSSKDVEITITATYYIFETTRAFLNGTLEGTGTDWLNQTPFTLSAIIHEDDEGLVGPTHHGYFEDFQLTYPASTVPIPGTVWLLGTGVLGLLCLGRRRKG